MSEICIWIQALFALAAREIIGFLMKHQQHPEAVKSAKNASNPWFKWFFRNSMLERVTGSLGAVSGPKHYKYSGFCDSWKLFLAVFLWHFFVWAVVWTFWSGHFDCTFSAFVCLRLYWVHTAALLIVYWFYETALDFLTHINKIDIDWNEMITHLMQQWERFKYLINRHVATGIHIADSLNQLCVSVLKWKTVIT